MIAEKLAIAGVFRDESLREAAQLLRAKAKRCAMLAARYEAWARDVEEQRAELAQKPRRARHVELPPGSVGRCVCERCEARREVERATGVAIRQKDGVQ